MWWYTSWHCLICYISWSTLKIQNTDKKNPNNTRTHKKSPKQKEKKAQNKAKNPTNLTFVILDLILPNRSGREDQCIQTSEKLAIYFLSYPLWKAPVQYLQQSRSTYSFQVWQLGKRWIVQRRSPPLIFHLNSSIQWGKSFYAGWPSVCCVGRAVEAAVGPACPRRGGVQTSPSLFRLIWQQPLMVRNCALLGIIHLTFKKLHTGASLRFPWFVSVVIDSVPLYDDVNHFSEGAYISVKQLGEENQSCSISGKWKYYFFLKWVGRLLRIDPNFFKSHLSILLYI